MSKIIISILVAAVTVGSVFYVSFKDVGAHEEYLRAAAYTSQRETDPQSVILRRVEASEGSAFTPMWQREQYVRPELRTPKQKPAESEVESEEVAAPALVTQLEPTAVAVKKVVRQKSSGGNSASKKTATPQLAPVTQHILELLNDIRGTNDLVPFSIDATLTQIAVSHSSDMAEHENLSHTGSDGCTYTCRVENSGYTARAWAENVGFIGESYLLESPQEIAEYMVESWMDSKQHRTNILHAAYINVGIGVTYNGPDVYMTTDFALPK